jgi:hypothetical protein
MNIAGLRLVLEGGDSVGSLKVRALWQDLFAPGAAFNGVKPVAVTAMSRAAGARSALCPPETAATVMSSTETSLRTAGGTYWLSRRGVTCEITRDRLKIETSPEFWAGTLFQQRDMFLVTMSILLRLHHIYGFHGNGLEKDGAGILVIGDSGAGKTTLTLSLIRNGWRFLADDAIGLVASSGRVEARALRLGFSFTPDAMRRLENLGLFRPGAQPLGTGKLLCMPGDELSKRYQPSCVPEALFFCEVGRQERTELRPLTKTAALGLCMRQAVGLAIDPELTQAHMDLLRDLVEQSTPFTVISGKDVLEQPDRVSDLIFNASKQAI